MRHVCSDSPDSRHHHLHCPTQTVADNQTRLAAAAQQRQQQIQNDKVLTAQWRRIMDAQEKRRMMDVNKIKALQAKAERFAATMPDNRAQLRREEVGSSSVCVCVLWCCCDLTSGEGAAKQELAKQWRRTKWDAEDEKQRRKAEAKKALVLQQQRGLDAQVSGGYTGRCEWREAQC